MVKIQNIDEFKRIKDENFGYVLFCDTKNKIVMHVPNCKLIQINDYEKHKNDIDFHWFSTFSHAQQEFENIVFCDLCNP